MKNASKQKSSSAVKTGKTLEERLKKSEEKYRLLAEHVKDHVWLLDMNLKPTYVSPSAEKASGYTLAELEKLSLDKLLTKESFQKAMNTFSAEMLNAATNPPPPDYKRCLEGEFRCKDGRLVWLEATVSFFQDENGKPLFILGESRDITERKLIEEQMRNDQQELHSILDALPIGISWSDMHGNIKYNNRKFQELFGYTVEDMPDISTWRLLAYPSPAYREQIPSLLDLLSEARKKEQKVKDEEVTVTCKDGSTRQVLQTGVLTSNRLLAIYYDVTERKKFEESLKRSEDQYRLLADHMKDYVWLMDLNLKWKYISPSIEKFLGYTLDELKQLPLDNFLTKESLKLAEDTYRNELPKNMASRETIPYKVFLELECRGKDGDTLWIETTYSFIRDEEGKPVSLLGEGRDITKRKLAENALKKSEERYRRVFENAGLPMVIMEDSMLIFMVNDRFVEMSGYGKDEIEGKMKFADFIIQEDRGILMKCFAAGKGNETVECEARIAHRNGERFDVLIRLGHIPGAGQFIASFTDITSRKQAELALLESQEHLQKENIRLRSSIRERYRFCDIIGKSQVMQEVYEFILQAAATQANVIIYGESGTGKELVAKAIHETSDRSQKAFVTVHCGAIPETLMESEFFGYKKGAFTGANIDKRGYLDEADGGTLFLDEVGEIGLNMQVKLLRAVSGGGYVPVGSSSTKNADVRIIAATNRNIRDLVKRGLMREDFFYRIHILPIYLPSLRERKDDLPLLIDHFLHLYDKSHAPLPGHVAEALLNYDWPGNIRELQNVLHRYLTLKKLDFASVPAIRPARVEGQVPKAGDSVLAGINASRFSGEKVITAQGHHNIQAEKLTMNLKIIERDNIMRALSGNSWHRGRTASALGISRRTLFRKMQKLGLAPP